MKTGGFHRLRVGCAETENGFTIFTRAESGSTTVLPDLCSLILRSEQEAIHPKRRNGFCVCSIETPRRRKSLDASTGVLQGDGFRRHAELAGFAHGRCLPERGRRRRSLRLEEMRSLWSLPCDPVKSAVLIQPANML